MFNAEYSKWYTDLNGGRTQLTVGGLRKLISELPDDMPVKVSHQYDRHPVGISDPIAKTHPIAGIDGITPRGAPIYGPTGKTYLIFE